MNAKNSKNSERNLKTAILLQKVYDQIMEKVLQLNLNT